MQSAKYWFCRRRVVLVAVGRQGAPPPATRNLASAPFVFSSHPFPPPQHHTTTSFPHFILLHGNVPFYTLAGVLLISTQVVVVVVVVAMRVRGWVVTLARERQRERERETRDQLRTE
jgi:hypothetical protein